MGGVRRQLAICAGRMRPQIVDDALILRVGEEIGNPSDSGRAAGVDHVSRGRAESEAVQAVALNVTGHTVENGRVVADRRGEPVYACLTRLLARELGRLVHEEVGLDLVAQIARHVRGAGPEQRGAVRRKEERAVVESPACTEICAVFDGRHARSAGVVHGRERHQ